MVAASAGQKVVKTVGLVPMKIHSSRVPFKNIRFFHGKPLFWHIVNSLLGAPGMDFVIIDTDSQQIIDMVEKFFKTEMEVGRVVTHMRPEYLHGDDVSMNKVIIGVFEDFPELDETSTIIQTHTTNPLLR